ncbi:hypothetical protein ACHAWF_003368 [Thalassiosira exigua]
MRSRPNARHMSNSGETSNLFRDEERVPMRRRPVQRTQMGAPRLRVEAEKRKPVVEWTKAVAICFAAVSGFAILVWLRRAPYLRRSANFKSLDKCDINTYPLWQIEHLKELSLSGCEHVNLPADAELWSRFSSLTKIDLNNNSLTDLPNEMGVLPSLEILFLSENKFASIPKVVRKFTRLRILSLKGNNLRQLSTTHLPVSSLVWLILTNNKIGTIDANIGQLKLLRKLMLSHNVIEYVPVELGDCKNLELIRFANNNLNHIPKEVLKLPKLAWISLSGNPMSKPPKSIDRLIKESDFKMQSKILGKGASGTVYQATYKDKEVAVKIFKEKSKGSDGTAADEAAINSLVSHPLAISAIGVIPGVNDSYKGMVMDLLRQSLSLGKLPSFDSVTRDEGPAKYSERLASENVHSAVWNVVSVLEYIHGSLGVSHGDVYLHNVLRDSSYVARLSDWGASFVYDRGNADLAAIFERIEVLAFGRLVQNLWDWHFNMSVPDSTESVESISTDEINDGTFKDLIATILQPDQATRPSFRVIKNKLESMPEFKDVIM